MPEDAKSVHTFTQGRIFHATPGHKWKLRKKARYKLQWKRKFRRKRDHAEEKVERSGDPVIKLPTEVTTGADEHVALVNVHTMEYEIDPWADGNDPWAEGHSATIQAGEAAGIMSWPKVTDLNTCDLGVATATACGPAASGDTQSSDNDVEDYDDDAWLDSEYKALET